MSKNHRLSCSSSASTKTACTIVLKLCSFKKPTLLHERVSAFFVIVSSSLFLKEEVWPKTTHFYEKYLKTNFSKNNDAQQKCGHHFIPTVVYYDSTWKKIWKEHPLCVQALKKGEKQWVLGILYHNIYPIQKLNFQ